MKICIVGGTGNISTSVVKLLLEQGHEVVCFNRGAVGTAPAPARTILGDRSDRAAFERLMQAEKFGAAIDMICFNRQDAESSVRAFQGVGHFVQCSTVCTYGVDSDWLPVSEDHPLHPTTPYGQGKVDADAVFWAAHYRDGFPVTILKPSTTYGPKMGMLRQVAWEFSWIDRVRKGKPILVCGDGNAIHQFLHVEDAAVAFANVVGRRSCVGQTYNVVGHGFTTWAEYHRTAMKVLGRDVELVGVPYADLERLDVPEFFICRDIYRYHIYYTCDKIMRDVPEFRPKISLEDGMRRVIAVMDREKRIPDSDAVSWEDRIIAAQRRVIGG